MKKNVFAAAACALACVLTSCSSDPASGSSAVEYPINASIESVTEAPVPESAPQELEISPDTTEAAPETTEAPSSAEAPETTEISTESTTEAVIDWAGKWECVSLTIDGSTYDGEYMGVPLYAMLALELTSDGTAKAMSPMAGSETDVEWSPEEDHIVITDGKDELTASMQDDKLSMSDGETVYVFERVEGFNEFDYDEWFENYDYRDYIEASTGEGA